MKKSILTAITAATMAITFASSASAWNTTIRTIGNSTYFNSYDNGGYSTTVCRKIGNTIYCS